MATAERLWLPLDALTFDARLQMRDLGATGKERRTVSAEWVEHLADLLADGAEFDPLEAVQEERGKRQPVYWVWHGFHRGAAYRTAGTASVEVLVTPGTFADAQYLALAANGKQPLRRTEADCRRAFAVLLDTPHLRQRVLDGAKRCGGVQRAIALACSLSKGSVGKYLSERGLRADRKTGELVPVDAPPARASEPDSEPEPDREVEPAPEASAPATGGAPEAAVEMGSAYLRTQDRQRVERAIRFVGDLSREFGELVRHPKGSLAQRLVLHAKLNGVPLESKEVEVPVPGGGFATERDTVHSWPAVLAVRAALCDLLAALAQEEAGV
jgi:plasmid stabilization system protein ParE